MRKIILILTILQTTILYGQNYMVGDALNVVAIDGLNLRSSPSLEGIKIGKLDNGSEVVVVKLDSEPVVTISNLHGNWVLVRTPENDTGYVFDAFISSFPVVKEIEVFREPISMKSKLLEVEGNPELLKSYCDKVFMKSRCVMEYQRGSDGEGAHDMKIFELENNHKLILHQYWESNSTELELSNARLSEVYYLILNLVKFYPDEFYVVNEHDILHPQYSYYPCAVVNNNQFCFIKVVKKSEDRVSIFFFNEGT